MPDSIVVLRAAVLVALVAAPASAASTTVALGDSYASGVGTRTYLSDGTTCQRSVYAYPALVAASRGSTLNFRACSGAKIADVANLQLGALSATTSYVTVTVGGNDIGFSSVLTTCAKPAWASDCNGAINQAQSTLTNVVPGRLKSLFDSIRARAGSARVVVTGYPRLFNGEDCNLLTWFSPAEEDRLNLTADRLNSTLAQAANAAGFTFTDPTAAFDKHAVCDDVEWLNGLSSPTSESYHPNRTGHSAGYAPLVSTALGGSSALSLQAARTSATATATGLSSKRLEAQQRRYARQDRTIRPEVFRVPDLDSPAMKRAARRAGVDLSSRVSIDAADKKYAAAQARAYR